ncbi:HAD superfamily hydrolase (TIGR01509 family) [Mycobacterium sp. MAA66]|uniref:HAD family hydrolase n=1 Tax=Mycobacterium sp. MAA66 TaxID=3156297 RepID=UPI00351481F9
MLKAVLFDMDGTLVDSEKLWDVAMHAFYARKGGVLTDAVRVSTVGGSAENVMRIVYDDLGLDPTPEAMAESADWLHDYTGELFEQGLPWRPGAQELLKTLAASDIPLALVTNTRRTLAEQALKTIGGHYFAVSVCGDEVPDGKPAPDPYLRAAELLGVAAADCLAIEDSVTGAQSADAAGCAVLVVPNDVEVPDGPRRRHIESLAGLDVEQLRAIYAQIVS